MFGRHRRRFLARVEREKLESAIRAAEAATTGQIRVAVLPNLRGDLARVAELTAQRLGMTATRERNGVLIIVVPSRRGFYVWGDRAIHEKVGDEFWMAVARKIEEHFARGEFTSGLTAGIEEIGRRLAEYFPAGSSARNELPDAIVEEE